MSDTEKMNEAMYERLGEIAKFASNKRVELDPYFKGNKSDETHNRLMLAAFRELRQMCEFYKPEEKEPVVPGCPSLMPRQLPGGFDGVGPAEKEQDKFNRRTWSFCDGLFPIIHINTQEGFMGLCKINGRTFKESVVQEDCSDGPIWNGYIYDKGACVCMVSGMGKGKTATQLMTHAAFKAYVKQLSGCGAKYHNRRGFLRQNAARATAAKKGGAK